MHVGKMTPMPDTPLLPGWCPVTTRDVRAALVQRGLTALAGTLPAGEWWEYAGRGTVPLGGVLMLDWMDGPRRRVFVARSVDVQMELKLSA